MPFLYEVKAAAARNAQRRHLRAIQTGYGVAALLVAIDPVAAIAVARDLQRGGDDTADLFEAAMAALTTAKDTAK